VKFGMTALALLKAAHQLALQHCKFTR